MQEGSPLEKISLPGVIWIVLIIAVTAAINTYQAQIMAATGIDAFWFQIAVGMLLAAAKRIELSEDQRVIFDAVIEQVKARFRAATTVTGTGMEGMRAGMTVPTDTRALAADVEAITAAAPEPPSLLHRWLWG